MFLGCNPLEESNPCAASKLTTRIEPHRSQNGSSGPNVTSRLRIHSRGSVTARKMVKLYAPGYGSEITWMRTQGFEDPDPPTYEPEKASPPGIRLHDVKPASDWLTETVEIHLPEELVLPYEVTKPGYVPSVGSENSDQILSGNSDHLPVALPGQTIVGDSASDEGKDDRHAQATRDSGAAPRGAHVERDRDAQRRLREDGPPDRGGRPRHQRR